MACSNLLYLQCCSNPSVIIYPCDPTIDGTPNSSFVLGNIYYDDNNLCWSVINIVAADVYCIQVFNTCKYG